MAFNRNDFITPTCIKSNDAFPVLFEKAFYYCYITFFVYLLEIILNVKRIMHSIY